MIWIKLIGSVIALVGTIFIFDGRRVVKKYFNYGEENLATAGIKSFGFIIAVIGAIMMIAH